MWYQSVIFMREIIVQSFPVLKREFPDSPVWQHKKFAGMEQVSMRACWSLRGLMAH